MKARCPQLLEPHLVLKEIQLSKGGEWRPHFRGWCLAHIGHGISYWRGSSEMREVAAGSTLVLSAGARGVVRASQLSEVAISYFCVETERLLGFLSLREQHQLKEAAHGKCPTARVLASGSPLSDRFNKLGSNCGGSDSSARLQLLQLFMDSFDWDTQQAPPEPAPWMDGRDRFHKMLNQMVASEFVELSVSDLAPMMACSPRHLNRLFREELGASFREKQIELRMTKACELLATSNAKVVEVALESGYQSSSVFSELFKRHFGVSPGQWRRQRVKTQSPARLQL